MVRILETHGATGEHAGHWCWQGSHGRVRFRFYGKPVETGGAAAEDTIVQELRHHGVAIARLRQRHSRRVVTARSGDCGIGDALVTGRSRLALLIATADCVPVVLFSEGQIAAVHAGWRGIRSGIVDATIAHWGLPLPEAAVIGPAIGPCCYEVAREVARDVSKAAGTSRVVVPGDPRPHIDLTGAVEQQLRSHGVRSVLKVDGCTRCDAERLWSYRRDGHPSGRNLAIVWME